MICTDINANDFERFYKIGKALEPYSQNIPDGLSSADICAVISENLMSDSFGQRIIQNYKNWEKGKMLYFKSKDAEDAIVGKVFGEWTVLAPHQYGCDSHEAKYICRCSCGKISTVTRSSLLNRKSNSCGCSRDKYKGFAAKSTKDQRGRNLVNEKSSQEVLIENGLLTKDTRIDPDAIIVNGLMYVPNK